MLSYEIYIGEMGSCCWAAFETTLKECSIIQSCQTDNIKNTVKVVINRKQHSKTELEDILKKAIEEATPLDYVMTPLATETDFKMVNSNAKLPLSPAANNPQRLDPDSKNESDSLPYPIAIEPSLPLEPDTEVEVITGQYVDFQTKRIIQTKKNIRNYWIKGLIGVLVGVALLALSLTGVGLPFFLMYVIAGVSSLVTLYLGRETYKHAVAQFAATKKLSMESLFTVSTLAALAVSILGFFIPGLPMLFDAALLIIGFKNIGKAIEESSKKNLVAHSFRDFAPRKINLEKNPNIIEKDFLVANLKPNDIIIVYKNQTIPINGICLTENVSIYNTRVTGKTLPQNLAIGDAILAGCTVPADVAFIKLRVTKTEKDSYLALLDKRIANAETEKAPIEESASKFLQYFIPTVFAIAVVSAIVVSLVFTPFAAIQCAIAVLVSACPCTLGLVTPLARKTGLKKAAENGVDFKNGKSIEEAADIDTVVLDLNGTLTTGIPRVKKFNIPPEMLAHLAALESQSKHPIAQAICRHINEIQPTLKTKPISIDQSHHAGLTTNLDGEKLIVGNSKMMRAHQLDTTLIDKEIGNDAEHIIYFARGKKVIGYITLEDPLRNDAKATIDQLKKLMGKEENIHLCTGASDSTARKYAAQLGITPANVYADCVGDSENLTDKTKTQYIKALSAQGCKVAMIGDAGNDAPAIAASRFGIAVRSDASDQVTLDNAGAVINQNSLWAIVNTFSIAKQTISNIKQNLTLSVSYNLLTVLAFSGLIVAIGFILNPALGAALMILQTGLILLNLHRFKRQPIPILPLTTPNKENTTISNSNEKINSLIGQPAQDLKLTVQPDAKHSPASTSLNGLKFNRPNPTHQCQADLENTEPAGKNFAASIPSTR